MWRKGAEFHLAASVSGSWSHWFTETLESLVNVLELLLFSSGNVTTTVKHTAFKVEPKANVHKILVKYCVPNETREAGRRSVGCDGCL